MALTTVAMAVASDEHYQWFAGQVEHWLGASAQLELGRTRDRLTRPSRPDAHALELGRWRVRLEDMLLEDPDVAEDLSRLRLAANVRLAARGNRAPGRLHGPLVEQPV